MTNSMKRVFGIDLGTTYSSIAYVDEYGKAVIIPNSENQRITPSVVFFDGDSIVVGDVAKESSKIYPEEVVSFVKRSMGEPNFLFDYNGSTYRAEEISSYILKKLIQDAEERMGEAISDVVITCPAYFGINEREATKKAGEIAGLNVRQIINEPTAAAIAYGSVESTEHKVVLVYDLGGGTFDITLIDIKPESVDVICTGGDHNLGGKDWDDRIVAFLVEAFQQATGSSEDILEDPDTCQDLQISAEKAKKVLSQRDRTPISITHAGERVKVELDRVRFLELTADLLERTIVFTREMLEEAKSKGYDRFDDIILVGGSTRMPQVAERIAAEFNATPRTFEPDEAVAKGAAIYGWKLSINDGLIQRLSEESDLKVENDGSGDIEAIARQMAVTPEKLREVEQEVADATGYSLPTIQRARVQVRNVTSKSFGVVAHNKHNYEIVFNLIVRNTQVPVTVDQRFYTAVADQESVLIRIMESETSEREVPLAYAMEIGTATLMLPRGLPADVPIDITFKLDEEGCLEITAVETQNAQQVDVSIDTSSVISGEALEQAKARCQNLVVH